MSVSNILALPFMQPSQAQKHVTHNEALELLDTVVQLVVESFDATTPPVPPVAGEVHAVGAGASGAWAGQEGRLAVWQESGWQFIPPRDGWRAALRASGEIRVWQGTAWVSPPVGRLDDLSGIGIGTVADATNRLSVAADATLLSHEGSSHQLKINKAASGDTASLLFQSGWSGRAEMGLAGNDGFSVKVSADGGAWTTALSFDPASGTASGTASGAAVQQAAGDTTAGRLMRADYGYGPGNLLGSVSQSGGLPTGAAIETGSNANGNYTRFADGTQICWFDGLSLTYSNTWKVSGSWTYPAAFITMATGSATLRATGSLTPGSDELGTTKMVLSTGSALLELYRIAGGTDFNPTDMTKFAVMAIGRWF